MGLKLGILFFIIIVSLGFASAACSPDQVILRLYSSANSHGAVYDQADYPVSICYNDIFEQNYMGADPHTCMGNNKVLRLSSVTNAHAEVPDKTPAAYTEEVCYGNLNCMSKNNENCPAGYSTIVKLSGLTNAHLSTASDTNYLVRVCCKSGVTPPSSITGAYWSNMIDTPISSADKGDTVKLNVAGADLSGEVSYTIYQSVSWWFDKKMVSSSSYGFTTWIAGKKSDGSFETGEYYFIAQTADGTVYDSRNNQGGFGKLTVSATENNDMPVARIIKPEADKKFVTGTMLDFTQANYDRDDDLMAIWDFGDGNITTISGCQTGANCNTTHVYDAGGTKVIGLTAKEMTRGQKASDFRRIFAYESGINIFVIITSPDPSEIKSFPSGIVDFNASQSFVADCTPNVCPAIPSYAKTTECYDVSNLKCYDLDNTKMALDTFNLWFNWTFDEGKEVYGDWLNNYDKAVDFSRPFIQPKEHWARLKVGYEKL